MCVIITKTKKGHQHRSGAAHRSLDTTTGHAHNIFSPTPLSCICEGLLYNNYYNNNNNTLEKKRNRAREEDIIATIIIIVINYHRKKNSSILNYVL